MVVESGLGVSETRRRRASRLKLSQRCHRGQSACASHSLRVPSSSSAPAPSTYHQLKPRFYPCYALLQQYAQSLIMENAGRMSKSGDKVDDSMRTRGSRIQRAGSRAKLNLWRTIARRGEAGIGDSVPDHGTIFFLSCLLSGSDSATRTLIL